MDRGTWRATVHGVAKELERLNNDNNGASTFCVLFPHMENEDIVVPTL